MFFLLIASSSLDEYGFINLTHFITWLICSHTWTCHQCQRWWEYV